jgi:hypothetical protein
MGCTAAPQCAYESRLQRQRAGGGTQQNMLVACMLCPWSNRNFILMFVKGGFARSYIPGLSCGFESRLSRQWDPAGSREVMPVPAPA